MNKHTHSTEVRHDSVIVPHFCPGHQKFKKKKEDRKEEDMKTENQKRYEWYDELVRNRQPTIMKIKI